MKIWHTFLLFITIYLFASCKQHSSVRNLPFSLDTITIDTIVYLQDKDSPYFHLSLFIELPSENQFDSISSDLIQQTFPLSGDFYHSKSETLKQLNMQVDMLLENYRQSVGPLYRNDTENPSSYLWEQEIQSIWLSSTDSDVATCCITSTSNLGIGEEYVSNQYRNYLIEQVKPIELQDILSASGKTENNLVDDIIGSACKHFSAKNKEELFAKHVFQSTDIYPSNNFYFKDKKLNLVYTPGEIAPTSQGEIVLTLNGYKYNSK